MHKNKVNCDKGMNGYKGNYAVDSCCIYQYICSNLLSSFASLSYLHTLHHLTVTVGRCTVVGVVSNKH